MESEKILILDTDGDRGREVQHLLEFANLPSEHHAAPGQLESVDEALAVMVPAGEAESSWKDTLRDLRRREVPAVVLDDGNRGPESGFFARLRMPLNYPALDHCIRRVRAHQLNRRAPRHAIGGGAFRPLVGDSPQIQAIRRMVEQVAATDASVLVLGESGTGKEVVAQNIHRLSERRDKPFVPINCGAIPGELLESELFGHEKGAFTGAITARQGRFELAEGGTIFLDEIGDMPMAMQVKLLRVLQERSFERVGGKESIRADVRVIAATHRDLESRIRDGEFREDLYYRLNVFPIETAPLRKCKQDLPRLIDELAERIEAQGHGRPQLEDATIRVLQEYAWPGNVRELANLIERLAILFPDEPVTPADLPERYTEGIDIERPGPLVDAEPAGSPAPAELPEDGLDLKAHIERIETELIRQALERADGVVAQAARLLDVRRTTLVEKLRKYGISRD